MKKNSLGVQTASVFISALLFVSSGASTFGSQFHDTPPKGTVKGSFVQELGAEPRPIFALPPLVIGIIGSIIGGGIIWGLDYLLSEETCNEKHDSQMNTLAAHQNELSQEVYDAAVDTLTAMWLCCLAEKDWNSATNECESSSS